MQENYYKLVGGFNAEGVAVNIITSDHNEELNLEIANDGIAQKVLELLNEDVDYYKLNQKYGK